MHHAEVDKNGQCPQINQQFKKRGNEMKSLLLTLVMLLISSAAFAADINGKWSGLYQGLGTLTFEFKTDGKKLYGADLSQGDKKTELRKGKIDGDNISFEVPVTMGEMKMVIVYKGKILNDNEIELTFRQKARGARPQGFGEGGGAGFNTGFGGGLGGFGGVSTESTKFVIKRIEKY
jgi:opacity protein-like surface antigen